MRRLGIGSGFMVSLGILASEMTGPFAAGTTWPGLRGPSWDGAVHEARLISGEGKPGLALGWKTPIGPGYSGVSSADGRIVTLFSQGDADVAAAFDASTGREIWRHRIAEAYKGHDGSHDGPLSSPFIDAGRVYGLGPRGHLFALDAATGKLIWVKEIAQEHGAKNPFYGFTTSPIVVDGVLIVAVGAGAGKAVAGFDPASGQLLWSAGDETIEYQSPIAATIEGALQVLAAGSKSVLGLEPRSGKVLWTHVHQGDADAMSGTSIIPVPAGEGRFLLKNKADSSSMIQVTRHGADGWQTKELWSNNAIRGSYAIPVHHEGFVYGMTGRALTCVDAATGETKWRSREPGDGFPTLIGSHLVMITKPGTLHVVAASPRAYHELARLDLFGEHAWSAVAFAGGHLYARSMGHIARIDVTSTGGVEASGGSTWVAGTRFGRSLEEVGSAAGKGAAVDAFLAGQKSFPIVEDNGSVHFIYRGKAEDVGIAGDMLGWDREDPMTRLEGTDLFHYSMRLPTDTAITYGFIVDFGAKTPDPRNPRAASGFSGEVSWFSMPGWKGPEFSGEAEKDRQGHVETIEWESAYPAGSKRSARVYLPAGYDADVSRRYPVVYFHDGKAALEQSKGDAKNALDHLTGRRIEPVIVVFIIPDQENADREMGQVDQYLEMLSKELVPRIDATFRTEPGTAARATVGVAQGASLALMSTFKKPGLFTRVSSLSAFILTADDLAGMIKPADAMPLTIYLAWGVYHLRSPYEAWDMVRANRELDALVRERGHRPTGGESRDGFGWTLWRARIGEMLAAHFPSPH